MTALQPPWATGIGGDTTTDDENSEWAPSNEPLSTFGVAEPSHGDEVNAEPESQSYGRDDEGGGSTPDVRMNLLTNVREAAAAAAPVIEHHHVMENVERGSESVRFHQEGVNGITPTTILQQNPARKRALLKIGGGAANTVQPTSPALVTTTSGFVLTVPAGQTWANIQQFGFSLTTDATVGNRVLTMIVRGPTGLSLAQYTFTTTQPASLTRTYQSVNGLATDALSGTTVTFPNILQGMTLPAGASIQVTNTGTVGGGDSYGVSGITATGVSGIGQVFLLQLRDGANAAGAFLGWAMSSGDVIEVKSQAGIEAICPVGGTATVLVYEELVGVPQEPGVGT